MKTMLIPAAYTDGSYNPTTGCIGCAFVMIDQKHKRPYRISFKKYLTEYKQFGSNIAEICAARSVIRAAISLGFSEIFIYHDWTGVEIFSHSNSIKKDTNRVRVLLNMQNMSKRLGKNSNNIHKG